MCRRAAKVKPTFRVVFMFLKLIFIAFSFYLPGLGKARVGLCKHKVPPPCIYIYINSDLYLVIAGGELLHRVELSE